MGACAGDDDPGRRDAPHVAIRGRRGEPGDGGWARSWVVLTDAIDGGERVEEREAAIAGCEETTTEEGRRVGAMAARYLFATFSGGQSSV